MRKFLLCGKIQTCAFCLTAGLLFFFTKCSPAAPEQEDLERVRNYFLKLRFNAVFFPELRDETDKRLLELSCQANRLDCRKVMDMLKDKDPKFYENLHRK